ncbi:transcription factor BHLH133-like [Hordeum vulgare subsp. vulgare]|uniref:transcription factor BHLH133-like n=1 Tax=Hordeum vulgare subsp. vulgare TaxID=112509 RepID=UPI001D1A3D96|nr:transcription factor BHLH133-like [Hordeum vulgare subsp. vulgare]
MEAAEYSSIWGSLDAICGESEMIAHLQSVLWCSSDSDANFCATENDSTKASFDLRVDDLGSANERNAGIKRKMQVDEQSDHHNEVPVALSAPMKSGRKSRAAMDSQSNYAKRRRHKINERLRVLQHLIPNGTKVDISTMLEEAVQYVKFVHLQIKLLSSDEMWMYAPLAYDSVNVRLTHLDSLAQE